MTDMLIEAMSKKKIKVASFKELINGWIKLYSGIIVHNLKERINSEMLFRCVTMSIRVS